MKSGMFGCCAFEGSNRNTNPDDDMLGLWGTRVQDGPTPVCLVFIARHLRVLLLSGKAEGHRTKWVDTPYEPISHYLTSLFHLLSELTCVALKPHLLFSAKLWPRILEPFLSDTCFRKNHTFEDGKNLQHHIGSLTAFWHVFPSVQVSHVTTWKEWTLISLHISSPRGP